MYGPNHSVAASKSVEGSKSLYDMFLEILIGSNPMSRYTRGIIRLEARLNEVFNPDIR